MRKLRENVNRLKRYIREEDVPDTIDGGLADGKPDDIYDPDELELGIQVEMEHTDDREVAKEIAKDHLEEIPDYYTRLLDMEDEAEEELDLDEAFVNENSRYSLFLEGIKALGSKK